MHIATATSFEEWREVARRLLIESTPPGDIHFTDRGVQQSLFTDSTIAPSEQVRTMASAQAVRVPKQFIEMARRVACHRDRGRFELLYRVLWRLSHGERHLLEVVTDDDVRRVVQMDQAVRRDTHKMKAFVRFRRVVEDGREHFIAWHRPDHHIMRLVAPFFARRFPKMDWSILTPDESVHWDQRELLYSPGLPASEAPRSDELEQMWRVYYASIFNPARIKLKAMIREMPVRHWPTLPETELIPQLLADSSRRVAQMIERGENHRRLAADFLPADPTIDRLREYAARCQGCELYCDATQTVFGEGPVSARLMLVGEQPGDMEDQAGRPFVGPAGKLLDEAMALAGIDRSEVYLTNAVKHFKFILRGKKRIHNNPSIQEAIACRPWLVAELELVKPDVLVCLGATAAQSLMGTDFRITRQRGEFRQTLWSKATIATFHPSAILRAPDPQHREQLRSNLVADLTKAAMQLITNSG